MITSSHNLPLFPEGSIPSETGPLFHESMARLAGHNAIAGVDEAGRGPLAGPVVAAAVILPEDIELPGIKDSKKMTEKARDRSFPIIRREAAAVSIGVVSHQFIDEHNILKASLEAMKRAVESLGLKPDYLLIDGIHAVSCSIPQKCLKKGDQRSLSISAASVMAKVYRDRIMYAYHDKYPVYGFKSNKGYGTAKHLEAIRMYGPCFIHRRTFKGVKGFDKGEA